MAAVVLLVVGACGDDNGDSDGDGTTTLRVAGIPPFSVTAWPLVVADDQGYFAEEAVEVDQIFTFDGAQLLAGNQVDVINDGADDGLQVAVEGGDVIAVAPLAQNVTDGLLARPEFETVADLEGSTLRTSGFGTDEYLLREFLADNGVDPDSIQYASVEDDGAALGQLEGGAIDGGMFDQGDLYSEEQGDGDFVVLAEPSEMGEYPWNTIQTTQSFAEENPEVITGFIAAIHRAVEFIQDPANRDAVVEAVLATGEGLEREEVELTYDAASPFDLYEVGPITVEQVEPALAVVTDFSGEVLGGSPQDFDLADFVDESYTP